MAYRLGVLLVALLLTAQGGFSQTAGTLTGLLRRISAAELVIEANDKGIVSVTLAPSTRYFRAAGAARQTDFQPGDRLTVEYTQDNNLYYHATSVSMIKAGTAADRSQALKPLSVSVLEGPVPPAPPPVAKAESAATPKPSSSSQTAAPPPIAPSNSTVLADSNDARPSLQRQLGASSDPLPIAPPTAPTHSSSNGAARSGPASAPPNGRVTRGSDADPVIESAREAAFSFLEALPNYLVKQYTTRYETSAAQGRRTSWAILDKVTADVACVNGQESYTNILVDGRPPTDPIEKSGSWSTGEYSSLQLVVLSEESRTRFYNQQSTTFAKRAAYQYDFSVEQPYSRWRLLVMEQSYQPAFSGTIWIDKENSRVLRVELSAEHVPSSFPLDTAESAVDYDYVEVGENTYLLPAHAEGIVCRRGTGECTRNVIEFRNYRKFTADTSITFDPKN